MSGVSDKATIVIQCAASKKGDAGHLRLLDGRTVLFVANPVAAPNDGPHVHAHPDDRADTGRTWREELLRYNDEYKRSPGSNPLGLLPAWQLYRNPTYKLLYREYGPDRLYILSAGWGLLRSDFLTSAYDITFKSGVDRYKRRYKSDSYKDLRMLPTDSTGSILFFGGNDYIDLFCRLTEGVRGQRYVYYNSSNPPNAPGCLLKRFATRTRTNWHYECAKTIMAARSAPCRASP